MTRREPRPRNLGGPPRPAPGTVGRLVDDYPDFTVRALPGGGCSARRRSLGGHPFGQLLQAPTPTRLAALMDAERARAARAPAVDGTAAVADADGQALAQLAAAYGEFRVSRNALLWLARPRQAGDGRRRTGDVLCAPTPGALAVLMDAARAARPGPPQAAAGAVSLLTAAEAAAALRVDPRTITRWARSGRLASVRTPGGTRRYFAAQVAAIDAALRSGPGQAGLCDITRAGPPGWPGPPGGDAA